MTWTSETVVALQLTFATCFTCDGHLTTVSFIFPHSLVSVTALSLITLCAILFIDALSSVLTVSSGKILSCQNVLRTTYSRL